MIFDEDQYKERENQDRQNWLVHRLELKEWKAIQND